MKSDLSSLDFEIAEVKYRIRALTQHVGEQGDIFTNIRDQINYCFEHEEDAQRFSKCRDLSNVAVSTSKDTRATVKELRELLNRYSELVEQKRIASKR